LVTQSSGEGMAVDFDEWQETDEDDLGVRAAAEVASILGCAEVRPPARVLDVGCGQGRHSFALASRGFEVVGIDLNPTALRLATRRLAPGITNPEFRQLDMRELSFADEFDLVVNLYTSFGFFATDDEHHHTLSAFARALRPGGFLVLETINRDGQLAAVPGTSWEVSKDDELFLDRHYFDPFTGTLVIKRTIIAAGRSTRRSWTIRLFPSEELARCLTAEGLIDVSFAAGFVSRDQPPEECLRPYTPMSRRICVTARKPETDYP
jgi:SAM-dependent methyltransferase